MSEVVVGQAVSATLEMVVTRADGTVEETIYVDCEVTPEQPEESA